VKDYKEYGELRDLMKKANSVHASLIESVMSDARAGNLRADALVESLFEKATVIDITEDVFMDALERVRLGNPPGKEGSMGDAVIRPTALRGVCVGPPHEIGSEIKAAVIVGAGRPLAALLSLPLRQDFAPDLVRVVNGLVEQRFWDDVTFIKREDFDLSFAGVLIQGKANDLQPRAFKVADGDVVMHG